MCHNGEVFTSLFLFKDFLIIKKVLLTQQKTKRKEYDEF